jgi:HK97 gp10 family phage protein
VRSEKEPGSAKELRDIANSDEIQGELRKLAKDIQRDARLLAPVRTGRLRRGIVIEEITDLHTGLEGYAVGWNDKAFYGWMVENGTEDTTARPHLVPAAIKNGTTVQGRNE